MSNEIAGMKFEPIGLADILVRERLSVPPNQREYSWEEQHVDDLFKDIATAIAEAKPVYFLGTVVLNTGTMGPPQIVDGQQRLATTSIFLAAVRDFMLSVKDDRGSASIEADFLLNYDRSIRDDVPRLRLNSDDNEFFFQRVLCQPGKPNRVNEPSTKRISHRLIHDAANLAAARIASIAEEHRNPLDQLERWVRYLQNQAMVILLRAPNAKNAFSMFETLNDRGLRTTQADILKNYLFEQASPEVSAAQGHWSSMMTSLEPLGLREPSLTYLRHATLASHGPMGKESTFYDVTQKAVRGKTQALQFLSKLAHRADDYSAILTPSHAKWNDYGPTVALSLGQMKEFGVAQIRPLMLAVANRFTPQEAELAFKAFVSWTVRFLIVGGMRGQSLEDAYAETAFAVTEGRIKTLGQLRASPLGEKIPNDARFRADFATATVSATWLATYYLMALEHAEKQTEDFPEVAPINDRRILNLEHILPVTPGDDWSHLDPQIASAYYRRIGNLVLLNAKKNSAIGNIGFKDKRAAFQKSAILLTRQVFDMTTPSTQWGPAEIDKRQAKLADVAVRTWPL